MLKDALPERYVVDRRGSPDPKDSSYFVLDVVHDMQARVVLRMLVRSYRHPGPSVRADELEQLLDQTEEHFARNIREQAALLAAQQKQKPSRGRTRSGRLR